MLVGRNWRGRGVGSALLHAAISRARGQGCTSSALRYSCIPAAIALYRKSGFVEEGRRIGQYRRASGGLWDSILMGLPLTWVNATLG